MEKHRVLVTVKTYPTLSTTYGETVCTAGVREDGTWVRIYPVPFRRLGEREQYSKYDWLELRLHRNERDRRPESYRPMDESELVPVGHMGTSDQWRERRQLLLERCRVYTRLDALIEDAKANRASLAVFRPTRVSRFVVEPDEPDWKPERLAQMRALKGQHDLFSDNSWRETFRVVDKIPWKFSYRFEDEAGKESEMQILDWEIGALYRNCLRRANDDQEIAIAKVKQKYMDEFLRRDLHFFVGTTLRFHSVAPNPWLIIGLFPIPRVTQTSLF